LLLKLPEDVVGKRAVEVVWNSERTGSQTERSRGQWGSREWPKFGNWTATADDNDTLPCLNSVEQSGGVVGKFLQADVAHAD
jgi:hypothetical protein